MSSTHSQLASPPHGDAGAPAKPCAISAGHCGALSGVRLSVKDNIEVEGQPYSAGHPLFADHRGTRTAPAVTQLIEAGAEVVGTSPTDSGGLGMTSPQISNPWLPGKTVGGSSGGLAAAVASGFADLGIGTDTGGSIRVPAACTGLYGFKPTFGRISVDGVWPLAPEFDHVGFLAKDLALLERATATLLEEAGASETPLEVPRVPLNIAVEDNVPAFEDGEIRTGFNALIATLSQAGHNISVYALPDRSSVAHAFGMLVVAAAREVYADLSPEERRSLGAAAWRALDVPLEESELKTHRRTVDDARRAYEACLASHDILLSPTLHIAPPPQGVHAIERGRQKLSVLHAFLSGTCFCNIYGGPALTIPIRKNPALSLQVTAARYRDLEIFSIGRTLLQPLGRRDY